MSKNTMLIALLIDGDNVQTSILEQLLVKVNQQGKPIIKKVFLNNHSLKEWEVPINKYSLTPVWVPNKTAKKNAADIELVLDAMQLLYEREDLEGFCIVSSDSDFTGLNKRIVSKGKYVLGIGERKTPESFINACDDFIYIEDLPSLNTAQDDPDPILDESNSNPSNTDQSFDKLFIRAYDMMSQNTDGWVSLLDLKRAMNELDPKFQSTDLQNTRMLVERIKELSQTYPKEILQIDERLDTKPITHYIRIIDTDMFKFIESYKNAPKGRDGWVLLSVIGDELCKYPAYEKGFIYYGIRRLNKIVNKMTQDYGEMLQIDEERDESSVKYLIKMNLA